MVRRIGPAVAVLATLLLVVVGVLVARSPGSPPPCAAPVKDPLDPRSLQHALPGATPTYDTEPPTSGPHQPGALAGGVISEPLPGPVQVGALEAGQVLLQHRDLSPGERSRLEALAGARVIVAPNPALPAPVVASAWRTRQLCTAVDERALRRFIDEHAGRTADHGG